MSRVNFGILKAGLFRSLTESIDRNDNLDNGSCVGFYSLIKETPFLHLENIFYKNMLNKHVTNSDMAIKYIDENVNLFQSFQKKDYHAAHAKLESFKVDYLPTNASLLTAIDTLLYESLKFDDVKDVTNIDALHEAYEVVLEHIKRSKKVAVVESKIGMLKPLAAERILKDAIGKFNDKYSHLNEDDKALLKILTTSDLASKKSLFESLKSESYEKLQQCLSSAHEAVTERIKMSIEKIERMTFNEHSATQDIIKLHNIKNNKK